MLERLGLVDGCGIDEWEADRRSRLANHLLFWIWYLPLDLVGSKLGHTSSIHDRLRLAVRLGSGLADRGTAGVGSGSRRAFAAR
jgi:hypothetical protein